MSQAKHTPGPWAMTADGSGFYVEGGNLLVAVAQEVDKHSPDIDGYMAGKETEANARLIAAAPTMYSYIETKALNGDDEAKQILEAIHASR